MKTLVIIPSRLSATRLPGKPLLKINGLSIISHVYKKALEANIGEVYVATEDQEIIDDVKHITLCSSSTLDPEVKKDIKGSGTIDAAEKVGKDIAAKAKKIGFEKVVFDRGGYLYHGRVRSLAEGARSSGLKF